MKARRKKKLDRWRRRLAKLKKKNGGRVTLTVDGRRCFVCSKAYTSVVPLDPRTCPEGCEVVGTLGARYVHRIPDDGPLPNLDELPQFKAWIAGLA